MLPIDTPQGRLPLQYLRPSIGLPTSGHRLDHGLSTWQFLVIFGSAHQPEHTRRERLDKILSSYTPRQGQRVSG